MAGSVQRLRDSAGVKSQDGSGPLETMVRDFNAIQADWAQAGATDQSGGGGEGKANPEGSACRAGINTDPGTDCTSDERVDAKGVYRSRQASWRSVTLRGSQGGGAEPEHAAPIQSVWP